MSASTNLGWAALPATRLSIHLLVVDDDDVDRERVMRLLTRSNLNLRTMEAATGAEALRMVREHEFDCVMLDNQLGAASGVELLPALHRESIRDCPIIMVTGAGNEALAVQVLRNGAVDYLSKFQLSTEVLTSAIHRALEHQQMQVEIDSLQTQLQQRVDVQALQIAERERDLRAILDHTPSVIGYWDDKLRNRFGNRAHRGWLGIDPRTLPGLHLRDVIGPLHFAHNEDRIHAVLQGRAQAFELKFATANGKARHVQFNLRPDIDEGGVVRGFYVTANDITEHREALAALVSARDLAEDAARTKSAFLANMSHEIRTPMNAIVGLSRLALEDVLPAGTRADLDKVHTAAVALMGLLDDVLDHSKIEAGQLRFEQLGFNLEQTLQRTADLFTVRIGLKGLAFVVDLPPELPLQLVGDALRLAQVLNNLVGNAVKFTEEGHVHVVVREMPAAQPGRCLLRFSVIDSGIGVAAAQHAKLFDAFMQADSSITRRFGGTGLGLTISQQLVEMMGGEMGMMSVPGRGSEFWFTANLLRGDVSPTPSLRQPSVAGLRVLLIEDGSLADQVNGAQLLAWQVRLTRATGAYAALRYIKQGQCLGDPFDAVLLDGQSLAMEERLAVALALRPVIHGAVVAAPALLMMSSARPEADDALADLLPDAVLAKPVMASPLLAALQKIAERRDSHGLPNSGEIVLADPSRSPAAAQAEWLLARAAPLAGTRVLVVEDNIVNQIVAQRILEHLGLEVHVVGDGVQALAALEAMTADRPFDAVLMDLHMPVMDGLEATRRIRERGAWASLPVIAMTAAALPEDRAQCFDVGMVDHLAKPLIPEGVLDVLLRWLPLGRRA
ncbi:MAG: response regulator [Rhizobacter sp.]